MVYLVKRLFTNIAIKTNLNSNTLTSNKERKDSKSNSGSSPDFSYMTPDFFL